MFKLMDKKISTILHSKILFIYLSLCYNGFEYLHLEFLKVHHSCIVDHLSPQQLLLPNDEYILAHILLL